MKAPNKRCNKTDWQNELSTHSTNKSDNVIVSLFRTRECWRRSIWLLLCWMPAKCFRRIWMSLMYERTKRTKKKDASDQQASERTQMTGAQHCNTFCSCSCVRFKCEVAKKSVFFFVYFFCAKQVFCCCSAESKMRCDSDVEWKWSSKRRFFRFYYMVFYVN